MDLKQKVDQWVEEGKDSWLVRCMATEAEIYIPNSIVPGEAPMEGLSYFPLFLKEQEIDFEEIMETESDMHAFLLNEEGETILQVPLSYCYYCTDPGSLPTKVRHHYNTKVLYSNNGGKLGSAWEIVLISNYWK